jgi:hypothetical protein
MTCDDDYYYDFFSDVYSSNLIANRTHTYPAGGHRLSGSDLVKCKI